MSRAEWLERWLCKAESAQQWWFKPNALSVVSGVTTLRLDNWPSNAFSCLYMGFIHSGQNKKTITAYSFYLDTENSLVTNPSRLLIIHVILINESVIRMCPVSDPE